GRANGSMTAGDQGELRLILAQMGRIPPSEPYVHVSMHTALHPRIPSVFWRVFLRVGGRDILCRELKGCTKTAFDPLRAASHQAAKASGARESLPQLILVALHATNLSQLLKDVPFFFVRKTLLERALFVADTLGSRGETWR